MDAVDFGRSAPMGEDSRGCEFEYLPCFADTF